MSSLLNALTYSRETTVVELSKAEEARFWKPCGRKRYGCRRTTRSKHISAAICEIRVLRGKKICVNLCLSVANFSVNYELRAMNSPRDQMREGVFQSLSKTCPFCAIFANFLKFIVIFC
jgi:hypothetical protein